MFVKRVFNVIIERDEDGWYVGSVPELPGCHTQAKTLEALKARIQEAIVLYLEGGGQPSGTEFIGVEKVEVQG